ncbi:hypothetical protein ACFPER_01845 [Agromyces aurantiacus]|uniref:Integral membrane protein n=1 Tax=Agromyces aurantiacus TaxID=165814 RepID=A0ABV9R223_9MICO|nr:hypothetical protein [Agromyces aurantiacus]MBM7505828.1 hypothetical protein [Agromyces aurantiacus]
MTTRGARAVRGAAIAAFATLVASLAHTIGGGTPPGPLALTLSLAFSAPLAMVLTGRRMPLVRASAAALVAQAALHLLYAVGTPGPRLSTSSSGLGAHGGHDAPVVHLAGGALVVDHGHAVTMPLAHLVAAAATVVALVLVERAASAVSVAFGTVVRGFRLVAAVLHGVVAPPAAPRVTAALRFGPPSLGILLLSSLRHRGPPWASSAA